MYEINKYYTNDFKDVDSFLHEYKSIEKFNNKEICIYDKYNYMNNIYILNGTRNKVSITEYGSIKKINGEFFVDMINDKSRVDEIIKSINVPRWCSASEMIEYLNTHFLGENENNTILALGLINDLIMKNGMDVKDIIFIEAVEHELQAIENYEASFEDKQVWIEEVFCSLADNNLSIANYKSLNLTTKRDEFFKAIPYDRDEAYNILIELESEVIKLRTERDNKEQIEIAYINDKGMSTLKVHDDFKTYQKLLNGTIQMIPLIDSLDGNVEAFINGDHVNLQSLSKITTINDLKEFADSGIVLYRYDEKYNKRTSLKEADFMRISQEMCQKKNILKKF